MAEYTYPGVYVEEISFRSKPIEGVDTTTAAFVGPTRYGPLAGPPTLVHGYLEFHRIFGGPEPIHFDGDPAPTTNFMAHAVKAFFEHGGKRAYIARVFGGGDTVYGQLPGDGHYRGVAGDRPAGLAALESIDDVAIVAAPGSSQSRSDGGVRRRAIHAALLAHCDKMRDRFAVLDAGDGANTAELRDDRARLNSSWGAMYYPWLRTSSLCGAGDVMVPPSGHIAGVFVRTDINRGVWKAPANEVIHGILGPERAVSRREQETLNPEGVNAIREFPGRGVRVWGARTVSNDPEWKYVNVRRYITYLERSIERGTRWAVFEPNGEPLWVNVRRTVEDFLIGQWRQGALLGNKPESAFFVRCDRTTMTQDDIDRGRLVVLVGVAVVKPTEFVLFRIGQWTADRK